MQEKRDLRVVKTYHALSGALRSLLAEKKFEDITVNELCERAEVRRATFYKHFTDKYDFFAFAIKELFHEHIERIEKFAKPDDPYAYYIGLIRCAFDFVDEYTVNMTNMLESGSIRSLLSGVSSEELTSHIARHLEADQKSGCTFPVRPELLAQLLAGALFQSSRWWYTHKDTVDRETLIEELSDLLRSFFTRCQGDPVKDTDNTTRTAESAIGSENNIV